ncbi:uncharacterized protein LOC110391113 [Numida meleagris]|uniref:uncharacterized protein LOC110391113 n=1 Tax=Numida meleagris TaxID=8996 RepID=UPI000B3DFFBB|nr:uncharacterized protein LOC110391113 [Numida meleagris]
MVVSGASHEKENSSPGPSVTGKLFPYGRVPVRTRSRRAEPGDRSTAAGTATSRGHPRCTEVEQPPPPAVDAETNVTPSPVATPVAGAVGRGPCLARRVPARAPPSAKGTSPLSAAGTQTTLPGSLRTQDSASMGLRVPKKKSSTPGSSSTGLTLRVSVTKNMRSTPATQHSFRTPCLTPHSSRPRALRVGGSSSAGEGSQPVPPACADGVVPLETPLRWRPAVTPQPDPSTGTADGNELSPSWDKVVVQLFKGNEGQQDAEGTMAHPSSTPAPSKAQRAALLLQQLLQMVQDRPDAVAVLTELCGLTAEWGVDPMPPDPLDPPSLSSEP